MQTIAIPMGNTVRHNIPLFNQRMELNFALNLIQKAQCVCWFPTRNLIYVLSETEGIKLKLRGY